MRFKSYPRTPFTDTARKRSHLRRKQTAEREALPLFSAQIAAAQPGEDEVMMNRARCWDRAQQRSRDERAALRLAWDRAPLSADPYRLLDFLQGIDAGRIRLDDPLYGGLTDPCGRRYDRMNVRPDQLDKLRAFAADHGPDWRAIIAARWEASRAAPWLVSLRVSHGADWLARVSLEDGRVHA